MTAGSGFYHCTQKEQVSEAKRIVLRLKDTGEFIDDFTAKNKEPIRRILRLPAFDVVEINPESYPQYDVSMLEIVLSKFLPVHMALISH